MAFEHILVSSDGPITTLTINRPERSNALNTQAIVELRQAVEATRKTPETRVIVITGAGERSFIGGADIHELGQLDVFTGETFIRTLHESMRALREHPAPVIAAVNGYALGAGLELVMSCDIAIASENAQLGMPEVKVGLPSVIECALMPCIIGLMRTRELLLTGDNIDAHEAHRIGLVNQVVPLAELPAAVKRMAKRLMANGPRALYLQKELIWMKPSRRASKALDQLLQPMSRSAPWRRFGRGAARLSRPTPQGLEPRWIPIAPAQGGCEPAPASRSVPPKAIGRHTAGIDVRRDLPTRLALFDQLVKKRLDTPLARGDNLADLLIMCGQLQRRVG